MNRFFKLAIILLLCLIPVQAFAWIQMYTCDADVCDGYPRKRIFWPSPNVKFYLNQEGSYQIPHYDVITETQKSIDEWNKPEISSLRPSYEGFTDQDTVGYDRTSKDNKNIIIFRDDTWRESSTIIALTTVNRNNANGHIVDSDIEINTATYHFGIVEKDGDGVMDYQNALTHELGHAFGLEHSNVPGATMSPFSNPGVTSLRDLGDDELEAIATIYPPQKDDSCSARPLNSSTSGAIFWIGMAVCALAGVSRRKRS